jgi:hypothetical protein
VSEVARLIELIDFNETSWEPSQELREELAAIQCDLVVADILKE